MFIFQPGVSYNICNLQYRVGSLWDLFFHVFNFQLNVAYKICNLQFIDRKLQDSIFYVFIFQLGVSYKICNLQFRVGKLWDLFFPWFYLPTTGVDAAQGGERVSELQTKSNGAFVNLCEVKSHSCACSRTKTKKRQTKQ